MDKIVAVVAVFNVLLIYGCGSGGGEGGRGALSKLPDKVEIAVGPNGLQFAIQNPSSPLHGVSVEIPPGAVGTQMILTVEKVPTDANVPGEVVLLCGPAGTVFMKPIIVTIPYDEEYLRSFDVDPQSLGIFIENAQGEVEFIQPTNIDVVQRRITVEVTHFSLLTVGEARAYVFAKQPYALFDESPIPYEIITTILPGGQIISVPVIARGSSNTTLVLGKGKRNDFWGADEKENVALFHGYTVSPTTFFYDDKLQVNRNDFLWLARNDPAFSAMFKQVIVGMYPTQPSIEEGSLYFAETIKKNAKGGFKTNVIAHSLGCIVILHAIVYRDIGPYLGKVFFLGGPFEGGDPGKLVTYFAQTPIGSLLGKTALPSGKQIMMGSSFLADLKTDFLAKHISTSNFFIVESKTDELVPRWSANPSYFNLPSSQVLTLNQESHWGVHGNAKTNGVAVWFREKVTGKLNYTPAANAGVDRTITLGQSATLDGSGSTDADPGETLTYTWTQTGGPTTPITNATNAATNVTPTQIGVYTFQLTVSDTVATGTATVTITVNPPPVNRATFYPVVDTYSGDQTYNAANPNRGTLPYFIIGDDGAGQNFWGRVSFDPVSTIVPQNATITKATFTLHEKTVWKGGTVSIEVGGGVWVHRPTGGSPDIDVTKEFQTLLSSASAGLPLFSCLITSNDAHLEYHSSESGAATTLSFTIEWQ